MSTITVHQLTKTYASRFGGASCTALAGISFDVQNGEFVGVMGPSGAGKTTLLNIIATIDTPSSGCVRIGDQDVTALREPALSEFRRRSLGFMFQDFNLLDTLSIRENVALPLVLARTAADTVDSRVETAASNLGISDVLDKYPWEVSGGQRQRAAAARAIVTSPALVLADEPTGALDSRSSQGLLERMEVLNAEQGTTIMMVTHDPYVASYCRRVLFISDGKLVQELRRNDGRRSLYDGILGILASFGGDGHDIR